MAMTTGEAQAEDQLEYKKAPAVPTRKKLDEKSIFEGYEDCRQHGQSAYAQTSDPHLYSPNNHINHRADFSSWSLFKWLLRGAAFSKTWPLSPENWRSERSIARKGASDPAAKSVWDWKPVRWEPAGDGREIR